MACASSGPRLRTIASVTRRRDCSVYRDYVPSRQTRYLHLLVLFLANPDPSTEILDFAIVPSTSGLPVPARNDARGMHWADTYREQSQQSGPCPHET